jgi:hypothetical protein
MPEYLSTANPFPYVGGPPRPLDFEIIAIDLLDPSCEEILEKSPTLRGYAELTSAIYKKTDEYQGNVEKAVHEAFDECITNGNPLSGFLQANRSKWESMAFEEFSTAEMLDAL